MIKLIKELTPLIYKDSKRSRSIRMGMFICDCGVDFNTRIRKNLPQSCGCIPKKGLHKTHNKSKISKTYNVWIAMKARCYNSNNKHYKDYGGRGIKIQEDWINDFQKFFNYIGERPHEKLTIERIDTNKDYKEGNIKWATQVEQANNRRNNRFLEFNNKKLTLSQWEKEIGISQDLLWARLKLGWSDEKALTTPKQIHKKKNIEKL